MSPTRSQNHASCSRGSDRLALRDGERVPHVSARRVGVPSDLRPSREPWCDGQVRSSQSSSDGERDRAESYWPSSISISATAARERRGVGIVVAHALGDDERFVEAMLREKARREHLLRRRRCAPRDCDIERRATCFGAKRVARIAGVARPLEIQCAEVREIGGAGRVAIGALACRTAMSRSRISRSLGAGTLRRAPRSRLSGGAAARTRGRGARHNKASSTIVGAANARRGCDEWHGGHFGAARYGNVVVNVLCEPTLSVQSGSAPGLQTACVGSSRSLKIAESPVSTTSSVSLRPP